MNDDFFDDIDTSPPTKKEQIAEQLMEDYYYDVDWPDDMDEVEWACYVEEQWQEYKEQRKRERKNKIEKIWHN